MAPIREREGSDSSSTLYSPFPYSRASTARQTRKGYSLEGTPFEFPIPDITIPANLNIDLLGPLSPLTDSDVDAEGETDVEEEEDLNQRQLQESLAGLEPDDAETPGSSGSIPFLSAVRAPLHDPITVRGQTLRPTIVYNIFLWLCAERLGITKRRWLGLPAPWTTNKLLQREFFCNTFRVLDRTSQYLITEVIEKGSQEPRELLFRTLLFTTFNKIATWELLVEEIPSLTWAAYKRRKYEKVLDAAKKNGTSLFSAAYQKQNGFSHQKRKGINTVDMWRHHLDIVQEMMEGDVLLNKLQAPNVYLDDIFDFCKDNFWGFGAFNSYQLILNLGYTKLFPYSSWDFVVLGPGARSGLYKMFGERILDAEKKEGDIFQAALRKITKSLPNDFARLGYQFDGVDAEHREMELADIEHMLCETDKYTRVVLPLIKGLDKARGMRLRERFGRRSPPGRVFPKAWDMRRGLKDVRIRRWDPLGDYIVDCIKDHRQAADGSYEFLVSWEDYPAEMDTWEPAGNLKKLTILEYLEDRRVALPGF
ncbi:hypothetical protein BDZ89DRAFT_1057990 [Hymenopellis radicata]|nr:hypothetical protein BDZ89DRAFT_1057990 [Hymenopellis radicata]